MEVFYLHIIWQNFFRVEFGRIRKLSKETLVDVLSSIKSQTLTLICDCLYVTFLENCPETKNSSLYVDLFFYHENLRKRNETGSDFYSTKLFKICRRESYISRLFWYTHFSRSENCIRVEKDTSWILFNDSSLKFVEEKGNFISLFDLNGWY